MVRGRLALIGDTAFVARPHAGMGLAKAAGDAIALVTAVGAGWSPAARGAFERERQHPFALGPAVLDDAEGRGTAETSEQLHELPHGGGAGGARNHALVLRKTA